MVRRPWTRYVESPFYTPSLSARDRPAARRCGLIWMLLFDLVPPGVLPTQLRDLDWLAGG